MVMMMMRKKKKKENIPRAFSELRTDIYTLRRVVSARLAPQL
jgi:hypothetical protein